MDASRELAPAWGTLDEWNRAYEKVDDFLRAHRVDSRLHRANRVRAILAAVAARPPPDPAPGQAELLAVAECRRRLQDWYRQGFAAVEGLPDEGGVNARLALLVADAPARWPYAFLADGPPPDDLRRALRVSAMRAGPDLSISRMVPRPISYGMLPDLARGTMATFARWPVLRTLAVWTLYLLALGALFWVTRR